MPLADFTGRTEDIVTPGHLNDVSQHSESRRGYPTRCKPLAIFRRAGSLAVIWKQWLSKSDDEFVTKFELVDSIARCLVDHVALL